MAGLVPAIHALLGAYRKAWMPATSAGMTVETDATYVGKCSSRLLKNYLDGKS